MEGVMKNGVPVLRNVGLVTSAEFAQFNMALAKELKRRTGCRIILYVSGLESVRSHGKYIEQSCIDEIVDCGLFYSAAQQDVGNEEAVIAHAREMEALIGRTYNSIIMANRDVGRGFALGGFHHPRSPFSDRVTYMQVVHAYNETLDFWRRQIEEKQIDLILNGTMELMILAHALKVPYRFMIGSRHKNYYTWSKNEFLELPDLDRAYRDAPAKVRPPVTLDSSYVKDTHLRRKTVEGSLFLAFLAKSFQFTKRVAYLRIKKYHTARTTYYFDALRFYLRVYLDMKKLRPPRTAALESIEGKRFAFYPLHTEPELSLQGMSPEYFFQLGAIASIARDLPAGVLLAVKDTIHGVGRRPRDFYDQIKEFKNVVLLDVLERGLDVVKRSAAVVTITGTAGLEAAMLGKPVILLGRHCGYDFLPHVTLVTREEDLQPALHRALDGSLDLAMAKSDGARVLEALINVSFDMRGFRPDNRSSFDEESVNDAVEALLASVSASTSVHQGDGFGAALP